MQIRKESTHWRRQDGLRVAGVSSFGFGGTNAHVVLSNAKTRAGQPRRLSLLSGPEVVVISARTEADLKRRIVDLRDWLAPLSTDALPTQKVVADDEILKSQLIQSVCKITGVPPTAVHLDETLAETGLDVDGMLALRTALNSDGGRQLSSVDFSVDQTLAQLLDKIRNETHRVHEV